MNRPRTENAAVGKWWDAPLGLVRGCTRVSEACANCWALACERRFKRDGPATFVQEPLERVQRARKHLVRAVWNDLFHERVGTTEISWAWKMMALAHCQTFVVLTKRVWRAQYILREIAASPVKNIILGTTCETQEWADKRIPDLIATPAAYRMLSLEPLLEPIDLSRPDYGGGAIDLVVVGPETGTKRRSTKPEWIISIVEQCRAAGVPVWVKVFPVGKRISNNPAEWPAELTRLGEMRQWLQPKTA